jgi:hypothetical protein
LFPSVQSKVPYKKSSRSFIIYTFIEHVTCVAEMRNTYIIMNFQGKVQLGRHRRRWCDNAKRKDRYIDRYKAWTGLKLLGIRSNDQIHKPRDFLTKCQLFEKMGYYEVSSLLCTSTAFPSKDNSKCHYLLPSRF